MFTYAKELSAQVAACDWASVDPQKYWLLHKTKSPQAKEALNLIGFGIRI